MRGEYTFTNVSSGRRRSSLYVIDGSPYTAGEVHGLAIRLAPINAVFDGLRTYVSTDPTYRVIEAQQTTGFAGIIGGCLEPMRREFLP